jgi:hypothetical protein
LVNRSIWTILWLLSSTSLGCETELSREYEFRVKVDAEPGRGLADARVSINGATLGSTDDRGSVTLRVRGREGDVVAVELECPAGHRSPVDPVFVPLRRLVDNNVVPEFTAQCIPTTRTLIVALRAEGGAHVPVRYLGRELARTDAFGAAHLMLDVPVDEIVELSLNTEEQSDLRPISPTLRVQATRDEQLVAVSQTFTQRRPDKPVRIKRSGPVRID